MTYERKPTVLVARQGYSGLSGAESCDANQQWDPNFRYGSLVGQCTPKGSPMTPAPSDGGGVLATIGSFLGGVFKGATSTPPPVVVAPSTTPDWLMPVAIGGIGLVAILLLTKKRSNPARRRRRR